MPEEIAPEIIVLKDSKEKPPYLLGLLCLIPIVGALLGIALIFLGIIKYKDKWITMIGIIGILITIGGSYLLVDYIKNGDMPRRSQAKLSQMNLNRLVRDIEFYKQQHKVYPDSLQQLQNDDKFLPIYDPLLLSKKRKDRIYQYKNFGEKYLLFSVGMDAIIKTKDDLFPDLKIIDSSKVGFLRQHP